MSKHIHGFFIAPRNDAGLRLIQSGKQGTGLNAFGLLYIIAQRCRYADKGDGLKIGQCYISTCEQPFTRRQTRTAISVLKKANIIATKATSLGTVVTLMDTEIFDVSGKKEASEMTNKKAGKRPENDQRNDQKKAIKEQGYKEHNKDTKKESTRKARGTLFEVIAFARDRGLPKSDAEYFFNSMEAGGWTRNGKAIKDWRAAFRAWQAGGYLPSQKQPKQQPKTQQPQRGYSY